MAASMIGRRGACGVILSGSENSEGTYGALADVRGPTLADRGSPYRPSS
jgi:hypothetical protein